MTHGIGQVVLGSSPGQALGALCVLALGAVTCSFGSSGHLDPTDRLPSQWAADLSATEPQVRFRAADALAALGPAALEAIDPLLASSDWVLRSQAVDVLGRIGEPALPLLERSLQDDEPIVRDQALTVLQTWGGETALAPALAALDDPAWRVRRRGLRILADLPELAAGHAAKITLLLEDPALQPRRWARVALTVIGSACVPALLPVLESGSAEARWRAAQVLAAIGSEATEALLALRRLLQDSNTKVRVEAARAIASIGSRK